MADIEVTAAYGSVVEDEGQLFVGFAEGEEEDEGGHGGRPWWCLSFAHFLLREW